MNQLSPQLRATAGGGIAHWCPACKSMHIFAIAIPLPNGARWQFDGNLVAPTFNPSMNIRWGKFVDPKCHLRGGVCHYVITKGKIQYQGDCTHAMRNVTIPLPDLPTGIAA